MLTLQYACLLLFILSVPSCPSISGTLTIKVKVLVEARLSDAGDENAKPVTIAESADGNDHADQDIVSGELRHVR